MYCAASGSASGPPARTRRALELLLLRVLVEGRLKVIDDRDMVSPLPLASSTQRLEFSRCDTPHCCSQ
jgi:hypothetical protein